MTQEHPTSGPAPSRHPWLLLAVVLTVLVTITVTVVALRHADGDARANAADEPSAPASGTPRVPEMPTWSQGPSRWVGYGDVEVMAPASWGLDYPPGRPDCIQETDLDAHGKPTDPWAGDVPMAPYVSTGVSVGPVPTIGCFRKAQPDDPDPAFGQVPFALWQPYISLEPARSTGEPPVPTHPVTYRGWRLTYGTVSGVEISVLSAPGHDDLATEVIASARTVTTTVTGCATTSHLLDGHGSVPSGSPIPPAAQVDSVAICDYRAVRAGAELSGSRRLTGDAAQDLVQAIAAAPANGGPDHPGRCVHDMPWERGLVLRFFGSADGTTDPLSQAYVYFDDCFGNGIFEPGGVHELTTDDCGPLFAEKPITLWEGDSSVFDRCNPS